jgi:LacI family transcriptional regulator
MAIVGFDDIPLAALVSPALTTCIVPRYDLGSVAMRLLLDKINGCADDGCGEIVFQPELVVRASAPQSSPEALVHAAVEESSTFL